MNDEEPRKPRIAKTNIEESGESIWRELRYFFNVRYVADKIIEKHKVEKKYKKMVEKQAEQIRACLVQAMEYNHSSVSVSIATRPVLLYYSIMNLALSEILFKQTGESSLDKARVHHRHHGLHFSFSLPADHRHALWSDKAIAKPFKNHHSLRMGTFELWHRSARHSCIPNKNVRILSNCGTQNGIITFLLANDERMNLVQDEGISLTKCLQCIPYLKNNLYPLGITSNLVRGKIESTVTGEKNTFNWSLIIHPDRKESVDLIFNSIKLHPEAVNCVDVRIFPSGFSLICRNEENGPNTFCHIPEAIVVDVNNLYFFTGDTFLNEFGYLHVSMYIMSMISRYYPDVWQREI